MTPQSQGDLRENDSPVQTALDDAVAGGVPFVIAGVARRDEPDAVWAAGMKSPAATPGSTDAATADTVIALHSVTKVFTATAALQCVEDGILDLDAPAAHYLPEIADLQVLESLGEDGAIRTRPPSRPITARMLLRHTSGLAYDMFDPRYAVLARERMRHPSPTPLRDSLHTPLLHDPGERWTYGTSIDWLGRIVAAVRGERLETVMRERIFEPCGLESTSFDMPAGMRSRLATLHRRVRDGSLVATTPSPPARPEIDMGGQGLYSTVPDVLRFLRVWLGDGSAPGGRVLRADTIEWAVRGVPGLVITPLPAAIPALTREAEFFPGGRTSWGASFLVTDDDVAHGRRRGSFGWAGLANVYWWVDRTSGVAAVWATQLLPFFDRPAKAGVEAFERAVYA